jgi:lysophospholipase L1-like esterase
VRRYASLAIALVLSYWVLWNTALVTAQNLGARDGIGYINGGKVFRLTGTMWYHIPGLVDIGLAPQNLGGRINLRNNEFALLKAELSRLDRTDVDFELSPNSLLLIILNRESEGTFWAVRLTAFEHPGTPFVNALVRYDQGRLVERYPLHGLPAALTSGRHQASVVLDGKSVAVTVDGVTSTRALATAGLVPSLALGCGELNTTIYRWAASGLDKNGARYVFEEAFSVAGTLYRSWGALSFMALVAWGLLLGLPLLKVMADTRYGPTKVVPAALLWPIPRLAFGLLACVPWTPLVLQWIACGLYVVFVWMTVAEQLSGAEALRFRTDMRPSRKHLALAGGIGLIVATAGLWTHHRLLASSVDAELGVLAEPPVATGAGKAPLTLGERILVPLPRAARGSPVTVSFSITLDEKQVAAVDFLRSLPTRADVFQVDRATGGVVDHSPTNKAAEDTSHEDAAASVADYRAVSALISSDPDLPGMLRWLEFSDVSRTPWGGWRLGPGTHDIALTVDNDVAALFVNGRLSDFRTDIDRDIVIEGVQITSLSPAVRGVSDVTLRAEVPASVTNVGEWAQVATLIGAFSWMIGLLGLVAVTIAPSFGQRRTGDAPGWRLFAHALGKIARASGMGLLWAAALVYVRWSTVIVRSENFLIVVGAIALLIVAFNVRQLHRGNTVRIVGEPGPRRAAMRRGLLRWGAILATLACGFESLTLLFPEWRFDVTRFWHAGLGPRYYWVHDPMVRRLNPWFIDQRFKRRDYAVEHDGSLRVVVFGGSQTYGWGIPSKDRMAFSDQLERALHDRGHSEVEVLSAAFPGVKTATGLRWFAGNLLRYQPDIIVVNFTVNEFMNVDQYHVWSGERTPGQLISPSVLVALLEHWRGLAMGNHLSQILAADIYSIYEMETYLRWTVELARAHNIEVVLSIEPTNLYIESGGTAIMREELPNADAKAVYGRLGAELEVPVFDVLPSFLKEPENLWFYDTMHMSRLGHKMFGEQLAALIATRFLEPPAATVR